MSALLKTLIQNQIEHPAHAYVNSEASFVQDSLYRAGEPELANRYWNWVCCGSNPGTFDPEIDQLQKDLDQLDRKFKMPTWGYRNS